MVEIFKRILLGIIPNDTVQEFINDKLNDEEIKVLCNIPIPNNLTEWVEFKDLSPALSMIGYKRLTNLEHLVMDVINNKIDGSFIETGVWKGGACMFVKYMFNKHNTNKKVYVADSFKGLPTPNADKYPKDLNDIHHTYDFLRISEEDVKSNFSKFNLLDNNVIFLKGWFSETLPNVDDKFSIIRLDGDMYESTMDALVNLYDKLLINGYVIIDDFSFPACSEAVNDFRKEKNITEEMIEIDSSSIYWKKTK
jgi:O-methyltransferase